MNDPKKTVIFVADTEFLDHVGEHVQWPDNSHSVLIKDGNDGVLLPLGEAARLARAILKIADRHLPEGE